MTTCNYSDLFERQLPIAVGICRGMRWQLVYGNRALFSLVNDRAVLGHPLAEVLAQCGFQYDTAFDPHSIAGETVLYQSLGTVYALSWKQSSPAPQPRWVIALSPIPLAHIRDEAALPWQEMNVLLDSMHDGIWVIDANGITLRVNKALERIANIKAQDVIGHHVTHPMLGGSFTRCVTLQALEEKRAVTMFDDYANGKRCLNTSMPIFDENGNVWRVIASIRDMTELEQLQRKLTELETETESYKAQLQTIENNKEYGFVGHSAQLRHLRKDMEKAARSEAITLIEGETGTGKTLAAKAIHEQSARHAQPFVAVNCGAIPPSLVESELFGYEKGAFTGASKGGKLGMFELAHRGTLLLDEIGELPLPTQAKLLQVLDGQAFHRVGGTKPINVDVRVLTATNRHLSDMVASGQFREDLFYRLRVISLHLPPLRQRVDDIPVLAMHFLRTLCKQNNLEKSFDPAVLNCFLAYSWPGNVRELRATVHSLVSMSEKSVISTTDLPPYLQTQLAVPLSIDLPQSLSTAVAELEKSMIAKALLETGSTRKAAKRLGISQSSVVRKAQMYNITI